MTVVDAVREQAAAHGEHVAVIEGDCAWTHTELFARVDSLSQAFIAAGLRKGDRLLCWLPNCHEAIETELACIQSGGVWVTLNAGLTWPEVAIVIRDTEPALFVTNTDLLCRIDTPEQTESWPLSEITFIGIGGSENESPQLTFKNRHDFERLIESQPTTRPEVDIQPEDTLRLRYTSGTTGRAKAAMLSHGVYVASLENLQNELHPLTSDDRVLHAAPLTHASAALMYPILAAGGANVILPGFDVDTVLDTIEGERITTMFAVPTMLGRLVASPGFTTHDLSSIRTISYGGAPMPVKRLEALVEKLEGRLMQIYGLTEALHPVTDLQREEHRPGNPRLGSIGKPTRMCEMRVVDEHERDLPDDDVGELWVKGPITMSGYWRNPEESAEVVRGEWIATGDLGYRDADGYYWIVDRKKDVIITGGFNVYPSEVETRLAAHPAVAEVAVIGLPHDDWGENVHAAVTLREGAQASSEELIQHCRAALAGFKTPKGITVWPEPLPKNSTGKILKRTIREQLEANRVGSTS